MRRTRMRSTTAPSFAPSGRGWAGTGIRYGSIDPLEGQCKRLGPATETKPRKGRPSWCRVPRPSPTACPSPRAGQSLAVAKKEEFSKSPFNSPASSGGTDGGLSAVPWPKQLHAQNSTPAPVEAMELVVALTTCADTVAAYNHDATNYYLTWLGEMASPAGPTLMHHVAAYFVEVLTSCCAWCACGPAEIWSLDSIVVVLVACGQLRSDSS
ncbi:Protein DWARF AND LOW-TILLERING [Zea mays]|uniref:Protein DWARF AND LOW-TILLERING n=1 Tax=Zea mays TaxID=4577 RepID=A0A3L6G1C4_MAIZE|nr:Protein DWARF AND LOW-TILLERING [Zea mays]